MSLRVLLPKILNMIFAKKEAVPKSFCQNLDKLFNLWCKEWKVFDEKYFQGLFVYTFDFDSMQLIEKYYESFITEEKQKYSDSINEMKENDDKKILSLAYEYGLNTESNLSDDIIPRLIKIKEMQLFIGLSQEIDGKIYSESNIMLEEETPKIQRLLKTMQETMKNNSFTNNNCNTEYNLIDDDIDGEPI